MPDRSFLIDSPTGAALNLYRSRPKGTPRAVLLIQHGLAEHAGRYGRVADELAQAGVATYVHDHRGHGSTTAIDAPLRRFASKGGSAKVLRDSHAVYQRAQADWPGVPTLMLGHSMGGHIALNYARKHGEGLAGLLVWNASFEIGMQERVGLVALRAEKALKGSDVASALFARATFEAWGKSISPRRTMADWLSHDRETVDRYIADPLCGWTPTISMVEDITALVHDARSHAAMSDLPRRLPVHCLGGDQDPATANGAAVRRLASRLEEAGSVDVRCLIVEGARHEALLEVEPMRGQAMTELVRFIEHHSAILPKPLGAP